jgi:RDD family
MGAIPDRRGAVAGRTIMVVSRSSPRPRPVLGSPIAASLIPWAAFVACLAVSDVRADGESASVGAVIALIAVSPVYLLFVALPSLLPLAAAAPGRMRAAVVAVMTATAALAGVLVGTSDDAQAGLAVLLVSYVGLPLGAIIWVTRTAANARQGSPGRPAELARPLDRLAALAIDVAIVTGVLVVPLTAMSHADRTTAAATTGVAVAMIYLGAPVALVGRTAGQWILRLRVVDARSGRGIGPVRALLRSAVVVIEVVATLTMYLAFVAVVDLIAAVPQRRTLADRLLRVAVVRGG